MLGAGKGSNSMGSMDSSSAESSSARLSTSSTYEIEEVWSVVLEIEELYGLVDDLTDDCSSRIDGSVHVYLQGLLEEYGSSLVLTWGSILGDSVVVEPVELEIYLYVVGMGT